MIVDRTLLSYPSVKSKVTLGDCAFIFAAPTLWNNIPGDIRESNSVDCFNRKVKTWLFKRAFHLGYCRNHDYLSL